MVRNWQLSWRAATWKTKSCFRCKWCCRDSSQLNLCEYKPKRTRGLCMMGSMIWQQHAQFHKAVEEVVLKPIERAMQPWLDGPRRNACVLLRSFMWRYVKSGLHMVAMWLHCTRVARCCGRMLVCDHNVFRVGSRVTNRRQGPSDWILTWQHVQHGLDGQHGHYILCGPLKVERKGPSLAWIKMGTLLSSWRMDMQEQLSGTVC